MSTPTEPDDLAYPLDEEYEEEHCPACGGGPLVLLGDLERLTYYQCRRCGIDNYKTKES